MRSLQRHVNKIFNEARSHFRCTTIAITRYAARQIAFKKAVGEKGPFEVTDANLDSFVGKPKFQKERLYDLSPPGVVTVLLFSSL